MFWLVVEKISIWWEKAKLVTISMYENLSYKLCILCISNCIYSYFVTKCQLVFPHFSPQEAFTYISSVYDNCFWCRRIIVVIVSTRSLHVKYKTLHKRKYLSNCRVYWAIWIFRERWNYLVWYLLKRNVYRFMYSIKKKLIFIGCKL